MIFSPFGGRAHRSRNHRLKRMRKPRNSNSQEAHKGEQLEQRRMLAFDFVAAFAGESTPFYISGVTPGTPELNQAPQQVTLRFSPGTVIDSSTLDSISVSRTGGGLVKLGSVMVNDAPNQNEVILRFAESLSDATYQINIGTDLSSTAFGSLRTEASVPLKLDLGAYAVSVVPQPMARSGGLLTQAKDQIAVYFNANDPLDQTAAETASNYHLVELDASGNDTATVLTPSSVVYDAVSGRALLTFASDIPDSHLYRLQVGNNGAAGVTAVSVEEKETVGATTFTDENSSFNTARDLGTIDSTGVIRGELDARPTVPTPAGDLNFPSPIGAIDEPGHRDIVVNQDPVDNAGVQIINTEEDHGLPVSGVSPAGPVAVQAYNFKSFYGYGVQGQELFNTITDSQKQRAREIFDLFSQHTGIRFVETASDGITVVTGDMRAIDPSIITTPDGLAGIPIDPAGARVFGLTAIMDSTINWGSSEYGGTWFREAMEQIGHTLGLSNSFDIPSIMGPGLAGEPVFPGNYDTLHAEMLFPKSGTDVDIYRFSLPNTGRLVAQTFVARPGQPILSKADTVLTLYRETLVDGSASRELIARNDDSYGTDSFLELELTDGTYYVAVTSTGNTQFNPEIENSGADGRTDGAYELHLDFTPDATIADTISDETGKLFDGDGDGLPGGVFNFWFRTGDTVFVDKSAGAAGADGSLSNPYTSVRDAIQNIGARSIIRIVGNESDAPYLIGRDASHMSLDDGATLNVPAGVTVMVDEGAIFKLSKAIIDVGTSSQASSRAGAGLQVLGIPQNRVTFTSYHDDTVGGDSDGFGPEPSGGQWGGLVFRSDSDVGGSAFLNSVSNADIRFGGGSVVVDSRLQPFTPIHLETSRPTIVFNEITNSAGAAVSADPNSFEDDGAKVGPDIRGNILENIKDVSGVGAAVVGSSTTVNGTVASVATEVTSSATIELVDASVVQVGATVTGAGIPDGTVVTDVTGNIVTLSQAGTVLASAELVFSLDGQSISGSKVSVLDPTQVRDGSPVTGVGVPAGTTVLSITGSIVELSNVVTLTEGTSLSFGWLAGQNQLKISDAAAVVGASLIVDGVDTGLTVIAIDSLGVLTLSDTLSQTLADGSLVSFSFVGDSQVVSRYIRVADVIGITDGGVVSGVPGVPPGTRITEVTPDSSGSSVTVELSQAVTVRDGFPLGFGSNSINGLFIRIKTEAGNPIDRLDVPARFKNTDITHVLTENLLVQGGAGGFIDVAVSTPRANLIATQDQITLPANTVANDGLVVGMRVSAPGIPDGTAIASIAGDVISLGVASDLTTPVQLTRSQSQATITIFQEQARQSGRLTIDPGVIVKLDRSRIELERGASQLIAEGHAGNRVVFTSLADNRFGAGGTFDTNGNQPDKFDPFSRPIDIDGNLSLSTTTGDWGGIMVNAGAKASIDHAYIAFGGGETSIEGGFDSFNVLEVHQGDLRLANSRIEQNAEGLAATDRTGRQGNDSATIFVRGAQPVVINNDVRDNVGAMISINANALTDELVPDPGRVTGMIDRHAEFDGNFGPLIEGNRISYGVNEPTTAPVTPQPASDSGSDAGSS